MVKIVLFLAAALAVANANFKPGKAPVHRLNDGTHIPCFGLGTYVEKDPNDITRAVETAIDEGYRHIDTATLYKTEEQVGQGVNNKIRDGTIKREDVYITTKIWNNKHRYDQVVPDLRESLKKLNLDYVDLYLIHTPGSEDDYGNPTNVDFLETWKGMEEAQRLGLTKSIGVSNFNETQIQKILDNSKVAPAVNQIEVNPNYTQQKLVQYCQERGVVVVAFSPLGAMPSSRQTKTKPAPHLDDPILTAIGNKYNKSTVQVVLRYLIDRNLIPIPKSVTPSRIRQNIAIFDFNLTSEEVAQIDKFDINTSIYEL